MEVGVKLSPFFLFYQLRFFIAGLATERRRKSSDPSIVSLFFVGRKLEEIRKEVKEITLAFFFPPPFFFLFFFVSPLLYNLRIPLAGRNSNKRLSVRADDHPSSPSSPYELPPSPSTRRFQTGIKLWVG